MDQLHHPNLRVWEKALGTLVFEGTIPPKWSPLDNPADAWNLLEWHTVVQSPKNEVNWTLSGHQGQFHAGKHGYVAEAPSPRVALVLSLAKYHGIIAFGSDGYGDIHQFKTERVLLDTRPDETHNRAEVILKNLIKGWDVVLLGRHVETLGCALIYMRCGCPAQIVFIDLGWFHKFTDEDWTELASRQGESYQHIVSHLSPIRIHRLEPRKDLEVGAVIAYERVTKDT